MSFRYEAYDQHGRQVRDLIEAETAAEAGELLRGRGLYVLSISKAVDGPQRRSCAQGGPLLLRLRMPRRRAGSPRLVADFARQLSVLVSTGTPLVQALGAVERQQKPGAWRDCLADIRTRVEEGSALSAAMQAHPREFDPICRSLISAGESSGRLRPMLDRLALMTRQQVRVRNALLGSMTYPCLLVVVAVAVLCVMIGFVMPRFEGLFESLDTPLPPSTKFLMFIGHAMRDFWWALAIAALAGLGAVAVWFTRPGARRTVDGLVLRLPVAGKIIRGLATARMARLLGALLDSHVPMLESLGLTRQAAGNTMYSELIQRAEEAVTRGETLSAVLRRTGSAGPGRSRLAGPALISPTIVEAVETAEQTGKVGAVLVGLADMLDEDNEVVVKSLASIVEPLILIALGLMVGFVALSMFMPLLDLTAATQGGS